MNQRTIRLTIRPRTLYRIDCLRRDGRLRWREEFSNIVTTEGLNDLLSKYFKGSSYTAAFFVGLIGAGGGNVDVGASSASVTGHSTAFAAGDNGSDILIANAGSAGADHRTTVLGNPASATALTLAVAAVLGVVGVPYAIEPRLADTMASHSFTEDANYSDSNRPTLTLGAVAAGSVDNSAAKAQFHINNTTRLFGAFMSTNNTKSGSTGVLYGGGLFNVSRPVYDQDILNVTATLTATQVP